mmetsp:Transcript_62620/g.147281  ORF Transcript_62620/g.147281 Transcript_62620/m.147281 type:complete len:81 (-) Transcript_62620:246-488(-)
MLALFEKMGVAGANPAEANRRPETTELLQQNTRVEAGKVLPQLTSLKIKDCGIQPELCVHTPYSRGLFSAFSSAKHPVII